MSRSCGRQDLAAQLAVWLACLGCSAASAQFDSVSRYTPTVSIEEADSADLERTRSFLDAGQLDEGVEILRGLIEREDDGVLPVSPAKPRFTRYAPLSTICQMQLAALHESAPQGLTLYRQRVDLLAKRRFDEAVENRDERLLEEIVERMFVSSYGDDALDRLGELALQRGEYTQARERWERISPLLRAPERNRRGLGGAPLWRAFNDADLDKRWDELKPALTEPRVSETWLIYPDTDLPLSAIRAKLVLVSILEGAADRAEWEIRLLRRLDADATGYLGGQEGKYVDLLSALLDQSRHWPALRDDADWPTFAGSTQRNRRASETVDIAGSPLWQVELPQLSAEGEMIGFGRRRISESQEDLLSYHPLVTALPNVGNVVLWNERQMIRSLQLRSGEPTWPRRSIGEIIASYLGWIYPGGREPPDSVGGDNRGRGTVGVARFTMTVHGDKLFARMGSPVTSSRDEERRESEQSFLVGLDLSRQGALLPGFPVQPDDSRWEFEGTPLADADNLYVMMRRSSPRGNNSEMHVACYDVPTVPSNDNRRPRWRVKVCEGNTPASGVWDELTHNLLALEDGTLYCNTNLGAVAAIRARDGRVKWITRYPRSPFRPADPGQSDVHYFRDLNPCVCYRGLIFVAPTDHDGLFALDAMTGQVAWERTLVDAVHLLGVGQGNLLAGGDSLYWIDVNSGRIVGQFPQPGHEPIPGFSRAEPAGHGRGVLVGDYVYWPTREQIFVFEQRTGQQQTAHGGAVWEPRGVAVIDLARRGLTGGNLIVADGVMLIATADKMYAFDTFGPHSATE